MNLSELLAEVRYPAQLAAGELDSRPRQAMAVLDSARETALAALAATGPAVDPKNEIWKVRFLAQELLELRQDAVKVVAPLLARKDVLSEGMRCCDVVYVLITRILHLPALPDFLTAPAKERDQAIAALRKEL